MAGIHKLVKSEEQQGNLPGYQHYRECSCGSQMRLGSKVVADSQFKNHQMTHGYVEPSDEEKNEPKNTQEQDALKSEQEKKAQESQNSGNSGASVVVDPQIQTPQIPGQFV